MPRPSKMKKVCQMPRYRNFYSEEENEERKMILQVEEYETLRLIDYLGMTQEECAASMEVGRATVQSLYTSAREKVARYLVEGGSLEIGGGNYELSEGTLPSCQIRIAVPWEDGMVFGHFGRARCFKIYDVCGEQILRTFMLESGEFSRRMLAELLDREQVQIVICGGIGAGARNALCEKKIEVVRGAAGDADSQVQSFLNGGGIGKMERRRS